MNPLPCFKKYLKHFGSFYCFYQELRSKSLLYFVLYLSDKQLGDIKKRYGKSGLHTLKKFSKIKKCVFIIFMKYNTEH